MFRSSSFRSTGGTRCTSPPAFSAWTDHRSIVHAVAAPGDGARLRSAVSGTPSGGHAQRDRGAEDRSCGSPNRRPLMDFPPPIRFCRGGLRRDFGIGAGLVIYVFHRDARDRKRLAQRRDKNVTAEPSRRRLWPGLLPIVFSQPSRRCSGAASPAIPRNSLGPYRQAGSGLFAFRTRRSGRAGFRLPRSQRGASPSSMSGRRGADLAARNIRCSWNLRTARTFASSASTTRTSRKMPGDSSAPWASPLPRWARTRRPRRGRLGRLWRARDLHRRRRRA